MSDNRKILVTVAEDVSEPEVRQSGFNQSGTELRVRPKEFDVETLEDGMSNFFGTLQDVLKKAPTTVGGFQLKEFTVSAEITAEGQLSVLGTGGAVGTTGGLTFAFTQSAEEMSS